MEIRDVVESDWVPVWGFMQPILAAGDTYCWPTDTTEEAARTWWMGKPGGQVFVAVEDGAVMGTAELHPNQPGAGSHVANAGFMVSPTATGRGVGRALARYVLEVAAREEYAAMQFNAVVETNEHAVRLWESLGFTILATVPEAFRHPDRGLVGLHVMHRFLR
ncbi:MAG TPA: GNAT family N-acetyltransferase [Propionibacteriaceae bacterium]|nr:GNAT family N-acetyltransferase [Propionibacteriaceae bacterium]